MNRRDTVFALLAFGASPCALAQSASKLPRIALFDPSEPTTDMVEGRSANWGSLLEALRRLGYIEGKTIVVERWSGGGDIGGYAALARKMVASQPQVIVERGRTTLVPIVAATKTIPIVAIGTIPVDLSVSLARPGKNVTGIQSSSDEQLIYAKNLEFLAQLTRPGASIAWFGTQVSWESVVGQAARTGATLAKLKLQPIFVPSPVNDASIRGAFAGVLAGKFDGVLVAPSSELTIHRKTIAELMAANRLPASHNTRLLAEAGLTMSYGPDYPGLYRRAAQYVDKLLKGAKPADLPIEQPTTYELVINLKAAKRIGLTVPQSLILRADRVIE